MFQFFVSHASIKERENPLYLENLCRIGIGNIFKCLTSLILKSCQWVGATSRLCSEVSLYLKNVWKGIAPPDCNQVIHWFAQVIGHIVFDLTGVLSQSYRTINLFGMSCFQYQRPGSSNYPDVNGLEFAFSRMHELVVIQLRLFSILL